MLLHKLAPVLQASVAVESAVQTLVEGGDSTPSSESDLDESRHDKKRRQSAYELTSLVAVVLSRYDRQISPLRPAAQ